jgi:hypothetical protein
MDSIAHSKIANSELKEWRKTMTKRVNNLQLLYIFLALVVIFIGVKWYQKSHLEKTLKTDLVDIDTAKVTKLFLYPACEKGTEIQFFKEGKEWKVKKDKIISEAEDNAVRNLLNSLAILKVKALVSKDKNKWNDYQVNDVSGTRVKVFEGKKKTADLYIGRFTYEQSNNSYQMYGGGGVVGSTYVRVADENETYLVDGFLAFSFNQAFNMFRKQSIARFEPQQIQKLQFTYPGDSSFVVIQENNKWKINGELADSSKVVSYLNSLSNKNSADFNDHFVAKAAPAYILNLSEKSNKSISIRAYELNRDSFAVNSSYNPNSFFSFQRKNLLSEIFVSKQYFLPAEKNKIKR